MPYDFNQAEQAQISALHAAAPTAGQNGNYSPMYAYIAAQLEALAATETEVANTRAWFLTATQANSGQGVFSHIIRHYTERQGQLHDIPFQPGVGALGIQEASNQVARNVYLGLLNGVSATDHSPALPAWRAPLLTVIAEADATAIRDVLFAARQDDTAFTANAAWTGAGFFGLLGTDQTFRFTSAGNENQVDRLDDYRNLVYYQNSLLYTMSLTARDIGYGKVATSWGAMWDTVVVACRGGDSIIPICIKDMLAGSLVEAEYNEIVKFGVGCRQADLIRNAFYGEVSVTSENESCLKPANIAGLFRTLGTQGQQIAADFLAPSQLLTLANSNSSDRLEARQALEGLSPFLFKNGVATPPAAALSQKTNRYYEDRARMLDARLAFDVAARSYSDSLTDSRFFESTDFVDASSGLSLAVRDSILSLGADSHVVFGGPTASEFYDTPGDDAFFGGAGGDLISSDGGADYLEGGGGNDSYVLHGGNQSIHDADMQGSLTLNDVVLSGGARAGAEVWRSGDNRFTFIRSRRGSLADLVVTDTSNGHVVTIAPHNFTGGLGITLPGSESAALPPTDLLAPGDTPVSRRNFYVNDSPQADLIDTSTGIQYENVNTGIGKDVVRTGDGADRISAGVDGDYVDAGLGRDVVRSGSESGLPAIEAADNDLVIGGANTDNLSGGMGDDVLYAGLPTDAIDSDGSETYSDWVVGGRGRDTIFGSNLRDFLNGGAGADVISGGAAGDAILGDAGFLPDQTGNLITFTNEFPGAAARHTFSNGTWSTQTSGTLPPGASFAMELTPISHFAWTLNFTDSDVGFAPQVVRSVSNRVEADGGPDVLRGGPGDDWIAGQAGPDVLDGGDGNDRIFGDDPVQMPAGSIPGADLLVGGAGDDRLWGNQNADRLFGNDGADRLYGDDPTDVVGGKDELDGGSGADELYGLAGDDRLRGGDGDDSLLVGGGGDDEIFGGQGIDTLTGDGEPGATGTDVLHGNEGDDTLLGNAGNDVLFGDQDNDMLSGDDGNDVLDGGEGRDVLDGGGGDDVYAFAPGDDLQASPATTISDASGSNRIQFGSGVFLQLMVVEAQGANVSLRYSDRDVVLLTSGTAVGNVEFADGRVVSMSSLVQQDPALDDPSEYADWIEGTIAADTLLLLAGDDVARALGGNDSVDGGTGADQLDGGDGNDVIHGGTGNDDVTGGIGADNIYGDDGDDSLYGGLDGDTVTGGAGNDRLEGSDGADTLLGDSGNDTIQGGAGTDQLVGGTGYDTYEFEVGHDVPQVGSTTLIDDAQEAAPNRVVFGEGVVHSELLLEPLTDTDVTLKVSYGPDSSPMSEVLIRCGAEGVVIEKFEFSDGSVKTIHELFGARGLTLAQSNSCPGEPKFICALPPDIRCRGWDIPVCTASGWVCQRPPRP